jgi:hypothetical protein
MKKFQAIVRVGRDEPIGNLQRFLFTGFANDERGMKVLVLSYLADNYLMKRTLEDWNVYDACTEVTEVININSVKKE